MPQPTEDLIKEWVLAHGISVVCGFPEEKRVNINYTPREDIKEITVQDVLLKFTGRMLKVRINLQMICTGKRIALGVILQEKEGEDFITRGIRAQEINVSEKEDHVTDIFIDDFCFTFPEWNLCVPRTFKICIVAHYLFPTIKNR